MTSIDYTEQNVLHHTVVIWF